MSGIADPYLNRVRRTRAMAAPARAVHPIDEMGYPPQLFFDTMSKTTFLTLCQILSGSSREPGLDLGRKA
jgi:hypothetical protein